LDLRSLAGGTPEGPPPPATGRQRFGRRGRPSMAVVPEPIEGYALAHTTPPSPAMQQIVDQTKAMGPISGMMTGPLEGRFLEFLVFALQAKSVLEIGTFTGYGATSMAAALPPGGKVTSCDINADAHATARRHAEAAGVADRIDFRLGPALETIA